MSVCAAGRACVVICLASAAWAFAFGVSTQAATLWLEHAGLDPVTLGLNAATYYLGMALAGLCTSRLLDRWGQRCVIAGMALFGGAVIAFPWATTLAGWFGLRLLQGVGGALSLIPLETYLSQNSPPQQITRNFGFYAVALTVAGAAGLDLGLQWFRPGLFWPFTLAGLSALAGALVVLALPAGRPHAEAEDGINSVGLWQNFLSYGTAWVQGFLEGGMLTFLPLYLLSLGLKQQSAGNLVGAAMLGVIVLQIPASWLADRLGKGRVLLLCYALLAVGLLAVPACGTGLGLGPWLFLLGGCSGALFPIGLALLGEGLTGSALTRAYAGYLTLDCLGSVVGPVCMGKARAWAGEAALFPAGLVALALVLLSSLVVWLVRYNGIGLKKTRPGNQETGRPGNGSLTPVR